MFVLLRLIIARSFPFGVILRGCGDTVNLVIGLVAQKLKHKNQERTGGNIHSALPSCIARMQQGDKAQRRRWASCEAVKIVCQIVDNLIIILCWPVL
jgi:hypothetical protein